MIDFCLVGGGFIGPLHAANIAAHPRARLRWIVDINVAAAEVLANKHGGKPTDDLAMRYNAARVAADQYRPLLHLYEQPIRLRRCRRSWRCSTIPIRSCARASR